MLKYFLTNILRNILHKKVFTLINFADLVIGFAAFALFSEVINFELNFDKFNTNYDRIYRVQTRQEDSNPINYCTFSPAAFRYHLMADVPEVEKVLLMHEVSGGQNTGQFFTLPDGSQLYEKDGYWSENSIFDIFTIKLIEGRKDLALTEPNTIALSKTLSKKLFPSGDAVGKQIIIGKRYPLNVSAVYADFPLNSSIRPTYLVSIPTFDILGGRPDFRDDWTYIDWDNFVLLKKGTDPKLVDAKISAAFKSVKGYEKSFPYLHPQSKWHLSPNNQSDAMIGLGILSLAAILVLTLSCVNYVNLSLAVFTQRATEVGIKKVVGASKKLIAIQFLAETVIHTVVAAIAAVFVAEAFLPLLNSIIGYNFDYTILGNWPLLTFIFGVSLLVGILCGSYPSFVISAYNPVKVLKGKIFDNVRNSFSLKKTLVVVQFSISLFILIVSFILYNHVNFILHKDLGFENNEILYSEFNVKEKMPFETIRNRLLQHPEITDASFSSTVPFVGNIGGFVSWEGGAQDDKIMISRNYVNYDFIPTYNLKLIYGRNFSRDYPADNQSCIINETSLKQFGWKDPIGKLVYLYGKSYPVIGVVKDFHPYSVQMPIPAYVMLLNNNIISGNEMVTIRFAPGNEEKAKSIAASELKYIFPNDPFEFKDFGVAFYMDKAIAFWNSLKKIFIIFAVISLAISSIGLFALILFTVKRKTKEIGIRKIHGSSVLSVYCHLSSEVLKMLAIAVVIGCPASWYIYRVMPGAYKEPLTATVFIAGILLIALIALLTISYHVLKVAMSNPVNALRYE